MNSDRDNQVIIAQCTPQGRGALALLRLCGENVFFLVRDMIKLTRNKCITQAPTHSIHYAKIVDEQQSTIDHTMVLVMKGPHTFTGQDTIEITCHNNQFLVETIMQRAIKLGARMADHGEFSKRAYLNKKLDLLQTEAINELICASSQAALKKSLAQLEGSLSNEIVYIEKQLLKALALSNASFEFLDEEHIEFNKDIHTIVNDTTCKIDALINAFNDQKHIRDGIRIALIGTVNAGKSCLFNQLVEKERAIVTSTAGTTRDVIEFGTYDDGFYITYIDTAGIRQSYDHIEQEGIKKSYKEAYEADIILLVYDLSRSHTSQEKALYTDLMQQFNEKIIAVYNKVDCAQFTGNTLNVSAKTGDGIQNLKNILKKQVLTLLNKNSCPYILNKRQIETLKEVRKDLMPLESLLKNSQNSYELFSYHLQDALEKLKLLCGKNVSDGAMDKIFKDFCIGK